MRTVPVDSADAREQRELEAEREAVEVQSRRDHAERCRRGWIGEDAEGHPIPCLRCRPWLAERDCLTCGTAPVACRLRAGVRRGPCCDACDHHPTPGGTTT